jgi:hypothetical protein
MKKRYVVTLTDEERQLIYPHFRRVEGKGGQRPMLKGDSLLSGAQPSSPDIVVGLR